MGIAPIVVAVLYATPFAIWVYMRCTTDDEVEIERLNTALANAYPNTPYWLKQAVRTKSLQLVYGYNPATLRTEYHYDYVERHH